MTERYIVRVHVASERRALMNTVIPHAPLQRGGGP